MFMPGEPGTPTLKPKSFSNFLKKISRVSVGTLAPPPENSGPKTKGLSDCRVIGIVYAIITRSFGLCQCYKQYSADIL